MNPAYQTRKPWIPLKLEVFGTARDITQGVGGGKVLGYFDDGLREIVEEECPPGQCKSNTTSST